jgi:hypothetical protein
MFSTDARSLPHEGCNSRKQDRAGGAHDLVAMLCCTDITWICVFLSDADLRVSIDMKDVCAWFGMAVSFLTILIPISKTQAARR